MIRSDPIRTDTECRHGIRAQRIRPAIVFVLVAGLLLPTVILAQGVLPAISVNADAPGDTAFDTPAALTVVELDSANQDSPGVALSEFLALVPGVSVRNRGNLAQDEQVSIRGFGARSTFGVRGVRLYADGIPATMPDGSGQISHLDFAAADRITVLRGPFSALYGNSSGGVIAVHSASGEGRLQIRSRAMAGSFGTATIGANLLGGMGPVGTNIDLGRLQTDGYRAHSAAQRDIFNAKLTSNPGVHDTLTIIANAVSIPYAQDPLGLDREQFERNPEQASAAALQFNTRKKVGQEQLGLHWERAIGTSQTLRVMVYGGHREVEQFLAIPVFVQADPLRAGGVIDLDGDYAGTDLRWSWQGGTTSLTIGTSLDGQDQRRRGYENFSGDQLGVRGALRRNETNQVRNFDQFAQATWSPTPFWSFEAGLRHSEISFRAVDDYINELNPDDSGKRDYSATTPVLGVMMKPSTELRFYASWGEGFETPTFAELGYRDDGGSGLNLGLEPARSRNFELGMKQRWNDVINGGIVAFRSDSEDEIAVATNASGRSTYRNVGQSRRRGIEAFIQAELGNRWSLDLAFTAIDARFRSGFLVCSGVPCLEPSVPVAAGARIPGIPESMLRLAVVHGGDIGWRFEASMQSIGSTVVNDIGSESAPGYSLLDVGAGYGWRMRSGNLRAFLDVGNVFDTRYVGSVIVNDGNGRYYEPGPGRNVMLGLRWNWQVR
ncbi:TonB-dependent receptor family protein [Dokdonella sp.]|uniref:TonB-dependent receptor family protein n=1 Tax=Dokdonella sp. TaxID=2291710 RepID=UPI003C5F83E6